MIAELTCTDQGSTNFKKINLIDFEINSAFTPNKEIRCKFKEDGSNFKNFYHDTFFNSREDFVLDSSGYRRTIRRPSRVRIEFNGADGSLTTELISEGKEFRFTNDGIKILPDCQSFNELVQIIQKEYFLFGKKEPKILIKKGKTKVICLGDF